MDKGLDKKLTEFDVEIDLEGLKKSGLILYRYFDFGEEDEVEICDEETEKDVIFRAKRKRA